MVANRKPAGTRQDNSAGRQLAPVVAISGPRPAAVLDHPATPGWLKATKEAWVIYWESDLSRILAPPHLPALYRLFDMRDAQARALRLYKRRPLVDGSMGQPVVNPAMKTAQALEGDIRALEDRLGLTPKAQANLGIAVGNAALTAAELNRMAEEEDEDDDRGGGSAGGPEGAMPHEVVPGEAWFEA